jgi:hypothetical protein
MPKVSRETASRVQDTPMALDRTEELDGYTVNFVNLKSEVDLTPMLQGLPNDQCPCPHWGYVFKGRMWFRLGDREESYGPGDAFYVPGGHTAGADTDSEFLVFSPTEQIADVEAHMMRRAQELQGA